MTAAANSQRRQAARLGSVLLGVCLPALLWAAPAGKRHASQPQMGTPAAPRVIASILGIRLGMDLDDARAALRSLGAPASAGADKDSDKGADKDADKGKAPAQDEDADEGHQEVWRLNGTPYSQIAFATGDGDKVTYVTGFVRPGQEIPFDKIGDVSKASGRADNRVLWNVVLPYNLFRVMAGGRNGRARVVTLISMHPANPNGIFSPQIMPKSQKGAPK